MNRLSASLHISGQRAHSGVTKGEIYDGPNNKASANAKPGRHSDGRGLYFWFNLAGRKSWVLRVQLHEVRRRLRHWLRSHADHVETTLCRFKRKSLTLTEAREKARIGAGYAKAGTIPFTLEQEAGGNAHVQASRNRISRQVSRAGATASMERNGSPLSKTTRSHYRLHSWFIEIDAPDVQAVLLPIWLTKAGNRAPRAPARRCRARLRHGKGWREQKPLSGR